MSHEDDDSSSSSSSGSGSDDDDGAIAPPPSTPSATGDGPVRPSSRSSSRPSSATRGAGFDSPPPPFDLNNGLLRVVSPGPAAAAANAAGSSSSSPGPGRHLTPLGGAGPEALFRTGGDGDGDGVPTPPPRRAYTEDELRNRPRSNPRTRTPMRNVSPMPQALNRTTVHDGDDDDDGEPHEDRPMSSRVTIRIGAGAPPGTAATFRSRLATTPERRRPAQQQQPRSSRQGPSKRKVRRWNNDRMIGVASDLANAGNGARGERAAEAFLRGEAEAGRYAVPNAPLNYRSEFARMADNDGGKYTSVRERFVRGEVAAGTSKKSSGKKKGRGRGGGEGEGNASGAPAAAAEERLKRIQPRLRAVLLRSCCSGGGGDCFAAAVARAFEDYLLRSPHGASIEGRAAGRSEDDDRPESEEFGTVLGKVLLRPPAYHDAAAAAGDEKLSSAVSDGKRRTHRPTTDFDFPETSSSGDGGGGGGFHRLLLHAVCQFHGLEARSFSGGSAAEKGGRATTARRIRVTGKIRNEARLLDLLIAEEVGEDGEVTSTVPCARPAPEDSTGADLGSVAERLSMLEVS